MNIIVNESEKALIHLNLEPELLNPSSALLLF